MELLHKHLGTYFAYEILMIINLTDTVNQSQQNGVSFM
jgi:hypothetical protein